MIRRFLPALVLLTMAAGAQSAHAQTTPTTIAFGDEPGALRLPEALAIAHGGDLLVGDHFSGRVQRFHDGRYVSSFGLKGEGCGRLGAIGGIATDAKGNSYVLDTDQQLVQVFDADGASVRCFGGRGQGLGKLHTTSGSYAASSASGGIAVSGGFVYVADSSNNRVERFSLTGKNPKILGKGQLQMPQGLAVKGSRVLVADDAHHRIVELTTSGHFVKATSADTGVRLRFPYDVAFDAHGGAYVADNNLHRIVQLDRHLRRVRTWGSQGHGDGKFVFPRAVAIQGNGHVLVADAGNDRVQEFTATGGFVRSIGIDGRARPHMTAPTDVAANASGEVAVADGNGRISWFDLTGKATGAWAQSRSFQQSTAVVTQPDAIDFLTDRSVAVIDGGAVREYADQSTREIVSVSDEPDLSASVDVGPTGTAWTLHPRGRFAPIPDVAGTRPAWIGAELKPGRGAHAIAELSDGTLAIAESTSPHQTNPADGTVLHVDATGKLLATWSIPRPPGGEASIPGGLAATADGGVWVTDGANDRLLRLAADGTITQTLGAPGTGAGQLADPHGLEIDCDGGLLVADYGNNRVQRFAGVEPARGCTPTTTLTAAGRPPAAAGLHLKTKSRAKHPAQRLGSITATCTRTCTLATHRPSLGVIVGGKIRSFVPKITISGSTIVVKAPAAAVKAMRAAVGKQNSAVTAGVIVTATTKDGVVDTAGIGWTFH